MLHSSIRATHINVLLFSCIAQIGDVQIWTKPVMPSGSVAFAFLNTGTGGTPSKVSLKLSDLGLKGSYGECNLFTEKGAPL